VALAQLTSANPEIVYIGDAYTLANALVGQARQKGIQLPFLGGDGWDSPDLDRVAAGGSYYTTHFSLDDQRPIVQDWVKKYQGLYQGTPDSLAVLGYDATNLLLSAISQAGVDDTSKVAQALAGITWDGVSGKIQFDQQHNPIKPVVIMQVRNSQDQYVTTVNP
jgi:branched-chain amino acid transport system substrate-binding protein